MSDFNENNQQALPPTTQATPLSRLPTDKYNWYKAQMNFWYAQIGLYQTQITALLASPVESYTFSGGQGQQSAKRRDLEQAQRGLEHANARYGYFWNKINGYGNVAFALRRR